jgi:hypothetical protein
MTPRQEAGASPMRTTTTGILEKRSRLPSAEHDGVAPPDMRRVSGSAMTVDQPLTAVR